MNRNLKTLGLALVAMLAVSAFVASAASATADLTAGASSGRLTATQFGENVFTTTPGTVKCSMVHGETVFASATITTGEATMSFGGCKAFGFLGATVSTNGCKVHGEGASEPRTLLGKIVCPAGKEITITTVTCVLHVPPQTLTGHTVATNVGGSNPPDVSTATTWEKMKYTETPGCPNVSNVATTENGTYTGGLTVIAKNTEGTQVSLVAD